MSELPDRKLPEIRPAETYDDYKAITLAILKAVDGSLRGWQTEDIIPAISKDTGYHVESVATVFGHLGAPDINVIDFPLSDLVAGAVLTDVGERFLADFAEHADAWAEAGAA